MSFILVVDTTAGKHEVTKNTKIHEGSSDARAAKLGASASLWLSFVIFVAFVFFVIDSGAIERTCRSRRLEDGVFTRARSRP